jgi:hypothetical protein
LDYAVEPWGGAGIPDEADADAFLAIRGKNEAGAPSTRAPAARAADRQIKPNDDKTKDIRATIVDKLLIILAFYYLTGHVLFQTRD